MDDNLIANKLADLQQYIPFLNQVINNLKNNNNDKPRPQQLQKMEMLYSLITNNDKKPLKLETLVKCETVVQKIYNKIEKQKDDSSNSSPVTVDSIILPTKTTDNEEIIEITEPDSPPVVDQRFHAPPIVIPTERKESPPSNYLHKGRKMNRWATPISESKPDDESIDSNFRRRIPTIDRSRNRNNDRSTVNFDRSYGFDYRRLNENEIYDNRRNNAGAFEIEHRNFERNSRCDIINDCFDIPSTTELFRNKDLRNFDYQNEMHFEKNDDRLNRYNLMSDESGENEFYKRNDNFQQHSNFPESRSFSDHLHKIQHDNYYRENVRHNPEESQFDWLNAINHERYGRDMMDFHKTTYDYKHDSRNINFRESPPRSHSRNHNRRDFDSIDRIDRQDNNASNWDTDDDSPDHAHLGSSISFNKKRIQARDNLIQVPIKKDSSKAIMKQSKSSEQLNNSRMLALECWPQTTEESDNSIFNRLGNKIDMSENFQIKVKNDRAIPISKAPLIKDVLKSPPLSAHDIDELYHESGGEVDNTFDAVRKKLAKISSKLKDDNLSGSPINLQPSSIKSPDPNRLAYKYNPHPRVSLDDPLSPKYSENALSKPTENSLLKSSTDPRLQKQVHTANTLPSVNPNDPRLKTWCSDLNTLIPTSANSLQIPNLLELNIPQLFDCPKQSNDTLSETSAKQIDSILTVDKNVHLTVNSSLEAQDILNYKKFHPLLNDQVERTKYLESKKNKPNTETTNKKVTTYKEHRQKAEEDKDNRRDSLGRSIKINKDKSRDKDIKNNDRDKKIKDGDMRNLNREKSGKHNDTTTRQFESKDPKHDKSKTNDKRRNDNIGNYCHSNLRNDGSKTLPNCLDSMYRTANYKKDFGSVASFKIPKKGKEEDKSKTIEQKIIVGKSNISETSKLIEQSSSDYINNANSEEKTKKGELAIKESPTKSLNASSISNVQSKGSESCKKADVEELNDIKIQPVKRLKDEKIKINLLKNSSEMLSPSSIEQDSDDNWVILSEIGTDNQNEESVEHDESSSAKENSELKNMEQSKIIEKCNLTPLVEGVNEDKLELIRDRKEDIVSKPVRARRKSVYDIATSDNSEVSTQNIISGKRRNRSLINLNENLLAISKVQITTIESLVSDATPATKKSNTKCNSKSKSGTKNKQQKKIIENLLTETSSTPQTSVPQPTASLDADFRCTTTIEDPLQNSIHKEEISKDSLESFLLDMLNPSTNKSRVLGMLEKVLDKNKFQQVKKIIEDDDTGNKKEFLEKKEEEVSKCIPESSVDSVTILKQENPVEKRKQKKKLTELDRLNVDIRDMFISKGVITATGRRMCTMMSAASEERDASVDHQPSRHQQNHTVQCKVQSKQSNTTKKKSIPNSPSYTELSNLNKIPKVVLSKVDITTVGKIASASKNRTHTKRRKRFAWSKGIISRKSKKLPGTKKATDNTNAKELKDCDEKVENKEDLSATENNLTTPPKRTSKRYSISSINHTMPVLKPITPDKSTKKIIFQEKPCPKSKKKFNYSNDEHNILIDDEPIIDNISLSDENSIFIDPSMPILATISDDKVLTDLPQSHDLLNVTKLKNIYSGMHAKSEYSHKCVLCKFTGTKVANHYTANHPDSEVFISRLPPDTLKDLLANKNNCALYSFRKQQSYVYHYRCPFCDIQQSFSRKSWIDHFSTHTGEYAYKCSICSRSMNIKQSIMSHFQNVCRNGQIILRPSLSKDIRLVEAFVCKICNFVQMVEKNVVKHLKDQHDTANGNDSHYNRIILININNIPLLDGNEEQQQAALADTIPKTNMDFIDSSQTETDKLDAFVPKEQSDLSLDKNFLNYMDDMSFSTTESASQILGKSSIIDQLSERLQSGSGDISFNNSVNCSGNKPTVQINRRYSIADQLSKRFKNVDQQNVGAQHDKDDNMKFTQHAIENTTNNEGSESPIPVVYILDNLDDDIDNVELAESSEQLIVPVDKPISVARANKLNEMMNDSNRNSDSASSNKNISNSLSIIARLNERFKSPQKMQVNKNKEVLQEKASISRPGTMIIDRLNKRLNSIDDREKPDKPTSSSQLSNELPVSEKTQSEVDDLMDTSDDRLVIDESFSEDETILNEVTGMLQPAKTFGMKNEANISVSSKLKTAKNTECKNVAADEECSADDDDWEDIEIMPVSSDSDTKSTSANSNNSAIDKNKNGTFYQTLSRLYAASVKAKNKSVLKNKKCVPKNKVIEEKKCSKKPKSTDSTDVSNGSPISYRFPDLVTDAIPSPVSNELTVDPPVPLPSEPLSDLNDISEILEPSATSETNTNNDNVATSNLGSPIDLCNIDDEDIFIINEESNIEDALALAAEMEQTGNDPQTKLDTDGIIFVANKTVSAPITDKCNTSTSTTMDPVHLNNIEINKNEKCLDESSAVNHQTSQYRIDKLGFSVTNGKVKYLCLVNSCSFLYSELEIGLYNHFVVDHSKITWDGFCHSCESIVCFDDEVFPLARELKHMTEVHINNIKKITTITTQVQNIGIPEKPKISLRRLSGDMLSIQPISRILNKDEIVQSNNNKFIEKPIMSSISKAINSPQTYGNIIPVPQPVKTFNSLKTLRTSQNVSIKNLLNTPSVPPPLPASLNNNRSKSPIILNNQLTKDFILQNRSVSCGNTNEISAVTGNVNCNSLLKKNQDTIKVYKICKTSTQQVTRCTAVQQPIKNNVLGGSNLVIASVAEGVSLHSPMATTQVPPPSNELKSLLKIQSVCSLNSQQTKLSIPVATIQEQSKITVSAIETTTKSSVRITEPVTENQIQLRTTIIPTSSNSGSIIVGRKMIDKCVQPWFHSNITKPTNVIELQLRPISLYAFYKCMSSNCFFTTNCSIKLSKHFICHEFSGATTNKSAALESNISYRDWLNCAYCKYHTETSDELLEHLKEIHSNDIYQCPYCFYRSCCECNVQQHQKNYHWENKPLIYVAFGDRKKLALEIRFLAKNRAKYIMPIPCNDCPIQFYLLRNYLSHLLQKHNVNSEFYTCGICKISVHKKSASYHLSASHNISIYQCIYCNVSSSIRSRMILHMTDEHPSNLLYSCVRVSPNKSMDILEETIENSTVLANLTEPVDPSILVECNYTLEQLNFMSPSLDAKSLQDNRAEILNLTLKIDMNKSAIKTTTPPQEAQSKNLKINSVESLSNTELDNNTLIGPTMNSSNNLQNSSANELRKSPSTLKISSILQNCTKFITSQSLLKSCTNMSTAKNTDENTTNSVNKPIDLKDKIPDTVKNNENKSIAPKVIENDDNINHRIIKAAKELVHDTGYEGYDLYRCAYPECVNIKITEATLCDHIQQKHARVRSLKCPHCTSQYQSARTLGHHLNTHRMHRFFCYFCNYTTITQQIITKHINDSHSKNVNITTVPLAYSNNSNINNIGQNLQDDCFYVTCPSNISPYEISQYGERLIRISERKKSLTKKAFKPEEIDQLPMQSIFHHEVVCSQCNYKTKVRINMYRHLLYHTKEVVVPSIDPVNPVPCLNTNEKHYDKMINLACSSNLNKDTYNSNNDITNTTTSKKIDNSLKKSNEISLNVNNIKPERKIPVYIQSMKRYVCGVNGCNYLTITDSMLKHHLNALHLTEKSYKCSHCKIECVKKQLCPDKIIQHLKFHDSKIFVCAECPYMHYQKHLVERHIYEKHPHKKIDLLRYERNDTDTIIYRQSYCGNFGMSYITTDIDTNKVNNNAKYIDDDMAWECTICKHRTINSIEMSKHVSNAHNIRFRYACLHCKFGAGQFKTVMEHITDKHPTKNRKVKCAFNRVDEIPVVTEDFLQQDNRPLWSRGDPHRVKNIRGILMEEEDESINTALNSVRVIPTISNNSLQQKVLTKSTETSETRIDVQNTVNNEKSNKNNTVGTYEKPQIYEETDTTNKIAENSTNTKTISNIESKNIDIYACSYCPIKNITFKTIYTHWLLHHCEKPAQKSNPVISTPFSFKLWGFMSPDTAIEMELNQITKNDLQRLERLGQKATRFQCSECWRLFANESSVTLHQETEHVNKTIMGCLQYKNITFYICNFCGYASSMECKTAAHLLNHYGGFKKCHLCNVQFVKFLDFVCHLIKHQITFSDFIENDSEIIVFWNQIKILYPNGLCMQRGILPNDLNNKELEKLVIEQINNAILYERKSIESIDQGKSIEADKSKGQDSVIEPEKSSIINEQIENNSNKETVTVLSNGSESSEPESVISTNTTKSTTVANESSKTKIKKRLKKRDKDNEEWMPSTMKKRKIQSESEDSTESDDDLIPLKYFIEDNKSMPSILTDSNRSTIVVPKCKPGPKCMRQKPYSFYGLTPEKLDLTKIFTTMKLGNDKQVVVSCENFSHFVNIAPRIYLKKIDINVNENDSNKTYKRKLSHLINNVIDEQLGYSTKKFRESS